jgi:excisionase family DNA binding protein
MSKPTESSLLKDSDNEWLTTREAAHYLRISAASLRVMTSTGQVPYYKLARRNRYRIEDLRALLKKKGPA